MDPIPIPLPRTDKARFEQELDFVQALASLQYVDSLVRLQHGSGPLLEAPAFIAYLDYLQYWCVGPAGEREREREDQPTHPRRKEPQYACFISHTFCLHTLDLLRDRNFRAALLAGRASNELVSRMDEQQNLSFFAGQMTDAEFRAAAAQAAD